jgi:ATP synthase protein I
MTGGPTKSDKAAGDIESGAERMQKSRESPPPSPLRGLGTFGMIGWSVAVPTVGGAFLGHWLDRVAPQSFSWTLALLLAGVVVGAAIAWSWVRREGNPE